MSDYTEHLISMAGGDGDELDLDAIQAQAEINKHLGRTASQDEAKNTLALLALVREQQARIERVKDLCNSWDRMATTSNTQDTTLRATSYAIRAALTATEGA